MAAAAAAAAAEAVPYVYLGYAEVSERLGALAEKHPGLVKVESAQERYGLPFVGDCGKGNGSAVEGCATWVVTLTERESLAKDAGRAEVLVSGEVHGDEVVGVHAVLGYLEMVAGKVQAGDAYFLRMVRSRVVVALPMANAVGFFMKERGERHGEAVVDPNRDFAFDQEEGACMKTVAARAINEIVREGLFRVLLTFHGGTTVIGYEWGDMTHCSGRVCKPAPDEGFMQALGGRMSDVAGGGDYEKKYPVGTMGALVYPVHGGMEDWAYGASWSGQAVQCRPETLGGYAAEKTVYTDGSNRIATFLVETAMSKRPEESTLGDDREVLRTGGAGDGHVPRNVRLIVAAVDAVEPYVVVSNATRSEGDGSGVSVRWHVGGAFSVGGTSLQWSDERGGVYGTSKVFNGTAGVSVLDGGEVSVFSAEIPKLPAAGVGLYFRIAAVVDQEFAETPEGASPDVAVQTHVVGARVDAGWAYFAGEKRVLGRRVVYSSTVRAVVDGESKKVKFSKDVTQDWSAAGLRTPSDAEAAEILLGLREGAGADGEGHKWRKMDPRDRNAVVSGILGVVALLIVTALVLVALWRHYQRLREGRREEKEAVYTISEEEELKEPLQAEEIVEEQVPALAQV